jgi:hypothetical protein
MRKTVRNDNSKTHVGIDVKRLSSTHNLSKEVKVLSSDGKSVN